MSAPLANLDAALADAEAMSRRDSCCICAALGEEEASPEPGDPAPGWARVIIASNSYSTLEYDVCPKCLPAIQALLPDVTP